MKKSLLFLFFLTFSLFFVKNVSAKEYSIKEYIPVEDASSVNTDLFYYQNMKFVFHVNSKGLALITFDSIDNHSNKKVPISINLLLFDKDKKNIGYLTYCSDKDIESDYANFKIEPLQSHVFAINLTNIYFTKDKSSDDLKYVVVFDENPYCQIGGYARYEGKTLDQIIDQINAHDSTFSNRIYEVIQSFIHSSFATIIIYILIAIVLLSITGNIINKLYYRFYRVSTNLAYIPLLNFYICVKLAFGGLVGIGYFFSLLLALLLWYFKIPFLLFIVIIIGVISFFIVIFKLITKKYDFLFFEPSLGEDYSRVEDKKKFSFHNDVEKNSDLRGNQFSERFVRRVDDQLEREKEREKEIDDKLEKEEQRELEKEAKREKKREMKLAKKLAKEKEREMKRKRFEELKKKKNADPSDSLSKSNNLDVSSIPISLEPVDKSSEDTILPLDELNLDYTNLDFKDDLDLNLDDDNSDSDDDDE